MMQTRIGIISIVVSLLLVSVSCSKELDVMSVRLSESSVILKVGETAQLTATVEPALAGYDAIVWSSSDPSVVTVSDGIIQVHKAGSAFITAFAGGVRSEVCTVIVDEVVIEATVESAGPETVTEESVSVSDGSENAEESSESVAEEADDVSEETENVTEESEKATEEQENASEEPEVSEDTGNEEGGETEEKEEENKEKETVLGASFVYDVDFGEEGSYISLDNFIKVYDWRGRDFNDYPNYWEYYGPFVVTVDLESAQCDMNGTRQSVPNSVTLIQTKPGETTAKDPESGTVVSLPQNKYGYLMCKFTTVGLTKDFHIYVKAKVKYGFGVIQSDWITIPVVMEKAK